MEKVQSSVAWYQQKIGSYDRQLWEQSVEQKVLKVGGQNNIKHAPRRVVKPKTELIDVDLVRGSTFSKAKPQVPWTYITLKTFSRVIFFPLHYRWWVQQTSWLFMSSLMVLYSMQIVSFIVFFFNVSEQLMQDEQSLSEVVVPFILMVLLGLIHSQTILTHLRPPVRDNKRDLWRRKRSMSQNCVGTADNVGMPVATETASMDIPGLSQSRSSMKGHKGSRPLRERTKEQTIRYNQIRAMNQRIIIRENAQDSESAYHTFEASDSIPERTSSREPDSYGAGRVDEIRRKEDNSSSESKLDISPRVKINGCETFCKTRESNESDFPQESNSDDEKPGLVVHLEQISKRSSQSISSDDDDNEDKYNKTSALNVSVQSVDSQTLENNKELNAKAVFEGVSVSSLKNVSVQSSYMQTLENDKQMNAKAEVEGVSVSPFENPTPLEGRSTEISQTVPVVVVKESDPSPVGTSTPFKLCNGASGQSSQIGAVDTTSTQKVCRIRDSHTHQDVNRSALSNMMLDGAPNMMKSHTHIASTVHFTKDLVSLREFTPKSSRESTPTHTPSDILLQKKHSLKMREKLDTDTESEVERTERSKIKFVNLRRRKGSESQCTEVKSSILRNRWHPGSLSLLETKSTTGVSSSDGETEGHSSEYSRGSRRGRTASSDEFGDHLQSDVDSTSEESSHSSPEISQTEHMPEDSETEFNVANSPYLNNSSVISGSHSMSYLQTRRQLNKIQSSAVPNVQPPDKVTCIIWERNECKKVELTALDIGWAIIETVDKIPESSDYIFIGLTFSILMGFTPFLFMAFHAKDSPSILSWEVLTVITDWGYSLTWKECLIHANAAIQRFCLSAIFFFLLSVADRTFKQRLLYAKHFCYLTSSRRAKKFELPHLRLNKVRNIRTWLSLRSYLKKRGPQRSVDVIVSAAFLITLIMLILMCLQLLREAETYLNFLVNWELLLWCMALGIYLLRFMTLGLRINKKYRNLSVLITEQINLYLQMEQKPHKKEELLVANNVLKLAESLLKELESPFKISGISANPLILNVTKVVVLSAFSAVLTELLGFKLKLYKIKLKA
ncbi:hypothetical protein DPMN_071080 [Dreissena polymorpha]|uniref:PHTF1/2 N-terminal domain-containing protein n=1 Tax=Dreissena polymorpha TaxID=45954 RepID=A0A9D3Z648_DREPO|nr:hypothetical protein DPMN_071080 [Dreissena polymorpha]